MHELHIVVDLHWVQPGWTGGNETLAQGLLATLGRLEGPYHFTVCLTREARASLRPPESSKFQTYIIDHPRQLLKRLMGRPRFRDIPADAGLSLTGYLQSELIHIPFLIVILDLQHEFFPQFFEQRELISRQYMFAQAIRYGSHFVAISEYTRHTLIERYRLSPEKVTHAHPGVPLIFNLLRPSPEEVRSVLNRYQLAPGSYLFYPAHTWPHKNHRFILEVLHRLVHRPGLKPFLVCTGQPKNAHNLFLETIRKLNLEDWVRWLGYLPAVHMPALYRGALALVYPSLFEGFGFPLLEAMASGCPIIVSQATCLPEIAGDAGVILELNDPDAWADAIVKVAEDSDFRQSLIERGYKRTKSFSWEQFALALLEGISRMLNTNSPVSAHIHFRGNVEQGEDSAALSIIEKPPLGTSLGILMYRFLIKGGRVCLNLIRNLIDQFRSVPMETQRLFEYTEIWWDGWVGPLLRRRIFFEDVVVRIVIRGSRPLDLTGRLSLDIQIDDSPFGSYIVEEDLFTITVFLNEPLVVGEHQLEIRADSWFIPHRLYRNGDYRPLSWRIQSLEFFYQYGKKFNVCQKKSE